MKRLFILVFLIFGMININEIIAFSSGITGYYNSTLGSSCMTCHGGTTGGATQLNFPIPPSGIVPNGIYSGSIRAQKNGAQIFGLSLVAQDAPMSNYGELIPFDSLKTQNIVGNLTHQKDGGLQNDSIEFKFYWKAPSTISSHTINFKWNVLCGNNDGNTTGDVVANGNQIVTLIPNGTEGLSKKFQIFPLPFENELTILQDDPFEGICIFNDLGQEIFQKKSTTPTTYIPCNHWKSGVYVIQIGNEKKKIIKK